MPLTGWQVKKIRVTVLILFSLLNLWVLVPAHTLSSAKETFLARSDDLKHKTIDRTALPYVPDDYPTSGAARFVSGSNILTSYRGYSERRPGYASFKNHAAAGYIVRRLFVWKKWAGSHFLMISADNGSNSRVYYSELPGGAVTLLYEDVGNTGTFDFTVANNTVWFANGNVMWKWSGSGATSPWGIGTSPMMRTITGATSATPIVITAADHILNNGDKVFIYGVGGNTAANGYWTVTALSSSTFSLDGSIGAGAPTYTSGGYSIFTSWTLTGSAGTSATVGYRYVYTYGNSTTKHQSNPSQPTTSTGAFTSKAVRVRGYGSADTQVDRIHVYRSTDGGSGAFYELPNSPITVTPGSVTQWSIDDTSTDINLQSTRAPYSTVPDDKTIKAMQGMNDPPESFGASGVRGKQPIWFANRIWFFLRNEVHFSGWEEIVDPGVEEESFPSENVFFTESEITGLASVEDYLLIFTASSIWRIEGDSLDTFTFTRIFVNMGVRERSAIATFGKACAFLDTGDIVRVTNGVTQSELSVPIRSNIEGITHSTSCMTFHSDSKRHWLLLANSTLDKVFVYDLDTEQWMPPWDIADVTALHSGETAAGVIDLLYGITTYAMNMTPTTYTDFISASPTTYTANGVVGLVPLHAGDAAGHLGRLEYIGLERNSVAITDVLYETDDDPSTASFTSIVANLGAAAAQRRTAGTDIVEEWYYGLGTADACRRIAFKFTWAAASTNFKLFTIDTAYKEMEK